MTPGRLHLLVLSLLLVAPPAINAEEEAATQLSKVAEAYVGAYNEKNLDAMLALYTEDAEMIDEIDEISASGPDEIRSIYERSFAKFPDRRIALEVLSVRQIAENVVVEEGVARFSGEIPNEEGDAINYSSVLVRNPKKGWLIASSRELSSEAPPIEPLEGLYALEGDWVCQNEQMQTEFSIALAPSGRFFIGDALVTTPGEGTMETEVRIGFDAATQQVRWWTFDEQGGFSEGIWQETDGAWLVRTSGVTADGESTQSIQEMRFDDRDTILWKSTRRFVDGEPLPDLDLRLVRRPPAPSLTALSSESDDADETDDADEAGDPQEGEAAPTDPEPSK